MSYAVHTNADTELTMMKPLTRIKAGCALRGTTITELAQVLGVSRWKATMLVQGVPPTTAEKNKITEYLRLPETWLWPECFWGDDPNDDCPPVPAN